MFPDATLNPPAAESRPDYELSILMEIGQLVLLDESVGRLRTEAATSMTSDEIERGKYALGEGITGNVVATGRARIIPDVRAEPDFLNRTGRLNPDADAAMS